MKLIHWSIISLFIVVNIANSQNSKPSDNTTNKDIPIPYTLSDRERLIKLETKVDNLEKKADDMQQQMPLMREEMHEEIKEIRSDIRWLAAGIFITGMLAIVGFILWDRRTYIKPFEARAKEIESTLEDIKKDRNLLYKLLDILKEKSKTDEDIASLLRRHHLL
ncbi:MAG: hypothetical protein OHK0036_15440 [Bacteroidia bacterium]